MVEGISEVLFLAIPFMLGFGFLIILIASPFFIAYVIMREKGLFVSRKKTEVGLESGGGDEKGLSRREKMMQFGLYVFGVLGVGVIVGVILVSIIIVDSTPQAVLKRNINNYDYFLAGREILNHETMEFHPQDSYDFIETTIEINKIPQLLETRILKVCGHEGYSCSEPIWSEGEAMSGLYCTRAMWKQSSGSDYTEVCVDATTGEFSFRRVDY